MDTGTGSDSATTMPAATSHAVTSTRQSGVDAAAAASATSAAAKLLPAERNVREAQRRLKESETLMSKFGRYRANDYAVEESDLRRSLILNTTESQFRWDKAFSWLLSLIIGVLNGIVGFLFTQGINWLNRAKFETTLKVIRPLDTGVIGYLVYLSFSMMYALAGALLGSYVSPQAAGSGIPEIRCYLNGIHVRGLLTVRTFFAKSFGVVLSVASGLLVGKEGPFTHVGAIIGGGVGHLGSTSLTRATNGHLRASLHTRFGRYFRSAVSHRDYVAAGAAAGVASAFAAPLGGILFSVEQGASFYNFEMLSHAFLSAGIAVYVSALLQAAFSEGPSLYKTAMATKQAFVMMREVPDNTRLWYYSWELPIFAAMGALGGMLGAAMVVLNNAVTRFRRRFIPPTKPARRVAEVVLLAALTATAWFLASYLSPCAHYPPKHLLVDNQGNNTGLGDPGVLFGGYYPQLWCPEGHYSEFGTLFFMPQMTSITMLFQYQMPNGASFIYSIGALVSLFLLGWLFMSVTFGIGAVTGLFVPSLLVGGAGGRLMGRLVRAIMLRMGFQRDDGTGVINVCLSAYAIVGAGSVLGGVSRMLLCNTVLVMETAAASTLMMPLIVTTFIAKAVADLLTPVGIFDLAIARAGYPYLGAELEDLMDIKLQYALTAGDVMSSQLVTLPAVLPVGKVVEQLRRYPKFSTFPLTEPDAAASGAGDVPCHETASGGPYEAAGPSPGAANTTDGNAAATASSVQNPRPRQSLAVVSAAMGAPGNAPRDTPLEAKATAAAVDAAAAGAVAATWRQGPVHVKRPSLVKTSAEVTYSEEAQAAAGSSLLAAPAPLPAPSSPRQPFHVPQYPQPRSGMNFLSAFAGGAAAAATAATVPGVVTGEVLRTMDWPCHRRLGPWGSVDRAEGCQGTGPVGLRTASAPLTASQEAAVQKLPAACPSSALGSSECRAAHNGDVAARGGSCTTDLDPNVAEAAEPLSVLQPNGNGQAAGIIIGTISRSVLLKLLEFQMELRTMENSDLSAACAGGNGGARSGDAASSNAVGGIDIAGIPSWLTQRRAAMSRHRASQLMDALDNYPIKAPSDRAGEEFLFERLGPEDLATHLDLRHYMQRVPYIVPATASLARTYRLFRGLGLHHIFVTAPSVPIIGVITRTNITPANAYSAAYDLAQREQAQLQSLLAQAPAGREGTRADYDTGSAGRGLRDGHGAADSREAGSASLPQTIPRQQGLCSKHQVVCRTASEGRKLASEGQEGSADPALQQQPQQQRLGLAEISSNGTYGAPVSRLGHAGNVHANVQSRGHEVDELYDASEVPPAPRQGSQDQLLPLPPLRSTETVTYPPVYTAAQGPALVPHKQHQGPNLRALHPGGMSSRQGMASDGDVMSSAASRSRSCGQHRLPAGKASLVGAGGKGGDRRLSLERDIWHLRLSLERSGRDVDGLGASGGPESPGGQWAASPTAFSEVGVSHYAGIGTGENLPSQGALRRRNRSGRREILGGGNTEHMRAAPSVPTTYGAAMTSTYRQPWPVAAPFSALVYGGGGGGGGSVPRRSTAPVPGSSEATATSLGTSVPMAGDLPAWGLAGRAVGRYVGNATASEGVASELGEPGDVEAPPLVGFARGPEGGDLVQEASMFQGEGREATPRRPIRKPVSAAVRNLMGTTTVPHHNDSDAREVSPPQRNVNVPAIDVSLLQPHPHEQQLRPEVSWMVLGDGTRTGSVETPAPAPAPAPPVEALVAATFFTPPPPTFPAAVPPLPPPPRRPTYGEAAPLMALFPLPPRRPSNDGATQLGSPAFPHLLQGGRHEGAEDAEISSRRVGWVRKPGNRRLSR